MRKQMLIQVFDADERLFAMRTRVQIFAIVLPHMSYKMIFIEEFFAAFRDIA